MVPLIANGFAPTIGDAEVTALRHRLLALFPSPAVDGFGCDRGSGCPTRVNGDGDGWDPALGRALRAYVSMPRQRTTFLLRHAGARRFVRELLQRRLHLGPVERSRSG
jgi:hypothetical protein